MLQNLASRLLKIDYEFENDNDVIIYWYDIIKVSCQYHYWLWGYDNFYLESIWPEIRKLKRPQFWNLPNIWRLELIRVSNLVWAFLMSSF